MTQEEKELVLKYLCMALPYKVICFKEVTNCIPGNSILLEEDIYLFRTGKPTVADYGQHDYYETVVLELKPYLRSMSSMTEKEEEEYRNIDNRSYSCPMDYAHIPASERINWLLKHHFDYRGLIKKGLAIEVTEENNPYKN